MLLVTFVSFLAFSLAFILWIDAAASAAYAAAATSRSFGDVVWYGFPFLAARRARFRTFFFCRASASFLFKAFSRHIFVLAADAGLFFIFLFVAAGLFNGFCRPVPLEARVRPQRFYG